MQLPHRSHAGLAASSPRPGVLLRCLHPGFRPNGEPSTQHNDWRSVHAEVQREVQLMQLALHALRQPPLPAPKASVSSGSSTAGSDGMHSSTSTSSHASSPSTHPPAMLHHARPWAPAAAAPDQAAASSAQLPVGTTLSAAFPDNLPSRQAGAQGRGYSHASRHQQTASLQGRPGQQQQQAAASGPSMPSSPLASRHSLSGQAPFTARSSHDQNVHPMHSDSSSSSSSIASNTASGNAEQKPNSSATAPQNSAPAPQSAPPIITWLAAAAGAALLLCIALSCPTLVVSLPLPSLVGVVTLLTSAIVAGGTVAAAAGGAIAIAAASAALLVLSTEIVVRVAAGSRSRSGLPVAPSFREVWEALVSLVKGRPIGSRAAGSQTTAGGNAAALFRSAAAAGQSGNGNADADDAGAAATLAAMASADPPEPLPPHVVAELESVRCEAARRQSARLRAAGQPCPPDHAVNGGDTGSWSGSAAMGSPTQAPAIAGDALHGQPVARQAAGLQQGAAMQQHAAAGVELHSSPAHGAQQLSAHIVGGGLLKSNVLPALLPSLTKLHRQQA